MFVHGMTGFMKGAEQCRHRVFGFKARGNTHVIHVEGCLKWMRRFILPTAAPIVTILRDDIHPKIPQLLFVVFFMQKIILDLLGGSDGFDQLVSRTEMTYDDQNRTTEMRQFGPDSANTQIILQSI